MKRRGRFKARLTRVSLMVALATLLPTFALADSRDQAKRLHDRIAGVPPDETTLTTMAAEIDSNPQVEVVWSKLQEQSQVRISGKMVVEEDEGVIQQFRADNPIVANLLPDAVQHLFRLYKLEPDKVYWAKGMVPYTEIAW